MRRLTPEPYHQRAIRVAATISEPLLGELGVGAGIVVHPSDVAVRHVDDGTFLGSNQLEILEQLARVGVMVIRRGRDVALPVECGDSDTSFERDSISARGYKDRVGLRSKRAISGTIVAM